jgi:hypothetical protein
MNASRAEIEQAIVNTVAYVDVFDFPLTEAEIHRYLIGLPLHRAAVARALCGRGLVPRRLERVGAYYTLPGRADIIRIRRERMTAADQLWPEATRYGRLIARMPFARMVAVTGSLAVDNADPEEDIDYLVITANDRLWVCRAFVILVVRAAARRGVAICPNYFLAERALRLRARDLYTAHELAQMIPLAGQAIYEALRQANRWVDDYLPNAAGLPLPQAARVGQGRADHLPGRRLLEAALRAPPGRYLDRWELGRKARKFGRLYPAGGEAAFSTDECKGHFHMHQRRTIRAYEQLTGETADDPLRTPT